MKFKPSSATATIALAFALLASKPAFSQPTAGIPADTIRKAQLLRQTPSAGLENGAFAVSNPYALISQRPSQIRVEPYQESFSEFYGAKIRGVRIVSNYCATEAADAIGFVPAVSFAYTCRNYPEFAISANVYTLAVSAKVQSPFSSIAFPQHIVGAFALEKTASSAGGFDYPIQSAVSFAYSADVAAASFTHWLPTHSFDRAGGLQAWAASLSAFPIDEKMLLPIGQLAITCSYTATENPPEHKDRNYFSLGVDVAVWKFRAAVSSAIRNSDENRTVMPNEASVIFTHEGVLAGIGVTRNRTGSGWKFAVGCQF